MSEETRRIESFADGVFSIAATLLIIDVAVQAHGGALGRQLLQHWPSYAAYAVSFLTIGVMWLNHHTCMRQIGSTDRTFVSLNLLLLMCIAFYPFPTELVAEHLHDAGLEAAALTYGATGTATAVCFNAFWFYAAHERRLIDPRADAKTVSGISRSYVPGVPLYATAMLVAFASPIASVSLYAAIVVLYLLESSLFGRAD